MPRSITSRCTSWTRLAAPSPCWEKAQFRRRGRRWTSSADAGPCTLIGGGKASPPYAAFYNTTLTRYLDFMDNYLGESETCHPCDNFASVLAATEYAGGSGRDFLTALALAYQVQCRLTGAAPIMQRGFDHTTQLSFSIAAGVAKALGLTVEQTAHAVAICGAEHNALAVIRAVPISQWKGLASSQTALGCVHATFLARRGVTGPLGIFEGPKGFQNAIGERIDVEWTQEDLEIVTQTLLKSYNSEVHTQPAVQCLRELHEAQPFAAGDVSEWSWKRLKSPTTLPAAASTGRSMT